MIEGDLPRGEFSCGRMVRSRGPGEIDLAPDAMYAQIGMLRSLAGAMDCNTFDERKPTRD